ncbi:MAG: phage major capsid protein [Oscillospiraceae bacterium]|nr:phage major capsid protein [Oscillospiraceae bacterium]
MYNDIKLDKSLYNISGKSFTQALSDLDPDSQYAGTELSKLDAYERQLKRFDIKVAGENCDVVDKFFQATESAVLFPEFIRRSVISGMDSAMLPNIIAVNTIIDTLDYRGFTATCYSPYTTVLSQNSELPEVLIQTSNVLSLSKYGRSLTVTYEAIKNQKLDLFSCILKDVGRQLGNALVNVGLTKIIDGATSIAGTSGGFVYDDLLKLYKSFAKYNLTTLVASPATCAALLALPELAECRSDDGGLSVQLPFGPRLYKACGYTGTSIIALDKDYAMEMITGNSGVTIENEKIISRQIDSIGISIYTNFRKIASDASAVLTYTA